MTVECAAYEDAFNTERRKCIAGAQAYSSLLQQYEEACKHASEMANKWMCLNRELENAQATIKEYESKLSFYRSNLSDAEQPVEGVKEDIPQADQRENRMYTLERRNLTLIQDHQIVRGKTISGISTEQGVDELGIAQGTMSTRALGCPCEKAVSAEDIAVLKPGSSSGGGKRERYEVPTKSWKRR